MTIRYLQTATLFCFSAAMAFFVVALVSAVWTGDYSEPFWKIPAVLWNPYWPG